MNSKFLLGWLLVWSVAAGTAGAAESTGSNVSATFTSMSLTAAVVPNPDKGRANYAGADFVTSFDAGNLAVNFAAGDRLMYCYMDISAYRTTTLPSSYLAQLQTSLNAMRNAGAKCLMLVAYDTNGTGNDAPIGQILTHIAQLGPYLKANADVIPFLKAGFIGAYGESWGSHNSNSCGYLAFTAGGVAINCNTTDPNYATVTANRAAWRDALIANTSPYTQLGFRFPPDIQKWFPTALTSTQAFTASKQARIGMHNDCPLSTGGGNQDSGTFLDIYGAGLSQTQFESYIQTITNWVAYFGEISSGCGGPQTDCPTAIAYMAQFHGAAFKMIGADSALWVNSWTSGGCFAQIINQLGYWIQLDNVTHQGTAVHGQSVTFNVGLRNLGNARIFTPRKLTATLCTVAGCGSGNVVTCQARLDMRAVPPQATSSFTVQIGGVAPCTIPNAGTYQVYLSIPDFFPTTQARVFKIRFGNSNATGQTWDDTNGWMSTGTTIVVS